MSLEDLHSAFQTVNLTPKAEPCQGLIFRYNREHWIGKAGDLNFRDRFRWNKTLSCDGCEKCDWMWDDLGEFMGVYMDGIIFNNPTQDKLYRLSVVNITRDWESGHVDGYDLEMVEWTPSEKEKQGPSKS
jgi:hypothetical protein